MAKPSHPGKPTVLIIEDEKILGDVLMKKLTDEGYLALLARDGVEGIAKIRHYQPAVVLLDIVMPKMDGYQVLEAMERDGSVKTSAVIVISNSGQPVEIERALALGAKDYLVKAQFSPDEVMAKVRRFLARPSPAAARATASGKNILIVEDDKFLRDLAVKKLTQAGYRVQTAVDGTEALRAATRERPDLMLLDIILPGMDGFEVLRHLQSDEQLKGIPVILLSNLGQESDVQRGLSLGAADYLVKAHFTLDEIIGKIKKYLR